MGITTNTSIVYTCDCCRKVVPNYFTGHREILGGDGRDVQIYADISLQYTVEWAGNQIICNDCTAGILQRVAEKLRKK